jgi:tellurite resistance protein TehA-like permease
VISRRVVHPVPPISGAVVMGTGIVSIVLLLDRRETLSHLLLGIDAGVWIVLGALLAGRLLWDREGVLRDARSPAALTGVAGTAVLGTALTLTGWIWVGGALLVIALGMWLALLRPVLTHWTTPTVGISLLLTVSTESLAVLAAEIASRERAPWLLVVALVPLVVGLCFYAFVIARFDLRQLAVGRGDHWITGGALAISTLAAANIALTAADLGTLEAITAALKAVAVVLWALTIAWLPVLLAAEVLRPRLGYDVGRWSAVFPVGMYAACSFAVGATAGAPAITDFARAWTWVAVAVWLLVAAAMVMRVRDTSQLWWSAKPSPPSTPGSATSASARTRRSTR